VRVVVGTGNADAVAVGCGGVTVWIESGEDVGKAEGISEAAGSNVAGCGVAEGTGEPTAQATAADRKIRVRNKTENGFIKNLAFSAPN
jgi:hypothetical protein